MAPDEVLGQDGDSFAPQDELANRFDGTESDDRLEGEAVDAAGRVAPVAKKRQRLGGVEQDVVPSIFGAPQRLLADELLVGDEYVLFLVQSLRVELRVGEPRRRDRT